MCPKLTQDSSSPQAIIPKNTCGYADLRAGDEPYTAVDGDTIEMIRPVFRIASIPNGSPAVYTIGYEGRTLDKFTARLKAHNVQQIIDVRERPISRKKGFSKTALMLNLEKEGIGYVHLPKLGSPSDIRHEYKEGGSEKVFFDNYRNYIKKDAHDELNTLEKYASEKTSALMCFELSFVHCHRKVLAEELKNMGYRIEHL